MTLDTTARRSTEDAVQELAARLPGVVHLPGAPSYDEVRMPWNVAVDQRPAAVAVPADADGVAEVVRAAAELGLRVAPQSTGHGAASLARHRLDDVVLLRTSRLTEVSVDPDGGTVRVGGGAEWQAVVEAAAAAGVAVLHGSSPDVGVSGYTVGGGIGWYARKYGLAANSLVAVELVTASGELVRADRNTRKNLFWAVRGGGGSFGVVTALELRTFPIADVYAGMMLWPLDRAGDVLRTWTQWCRTAPEEVSTSLRFMRFPPMPELPDFLRGRQLVVLDGAVLGDDACGERLVAPFRALAPELDTWARTPAAALSRLHMDPEGPTPAVAGHLIVEELTDEAAQGFLRAVGPDADTGLLAAELRQLGGALARKDADGGVLDRLDGSHLAFFVAVAPTAEAAEAGSHAVTSAIEAMRPWSNGRSLLNFADNPVDPATGYRPKRWAKLQRVRDRVDAGGVFLANHPVARS